MKANARTSSPHLKNRMQKHSNHKIDVKIARIALLYSLPYYAWIYRLVWLPSPSQTHSLHMQWLLWNKHTHTQNMQNKHCVLIGILFIFGLITRTFRHPVPIELSLNICHGKNHTINTYINQMRKKCQFPAKRSQNANQSEHIKVQLRKSKWTHNS